MYLNILICYYLNMLICHLQFSFLSPKFETKLRNGAKQNTPFEFYPKFRWGGSNLWLISDCPCEPREPGRWQLRHACSMLSSILYLYPVSVSLYQYPVICISIPCISILYQLILYQFLYRYPVSVSCISFLYHYPVSVSCIILHRFILPTSLCFLCAIRCKI